LSQKLGFLTSLSPSVREDTVTMFAPPILLALVSIVRVAFAQGIDPSTVPQMTRDYWCFQQTTSCPLICLQIPGADGQPSSNDCDPEFLSFTCVCSNGLSHNASEYSQTLPYFICSEINNVCVANCVGDSRCQFECRENNPCGAQSPRPPNSSTISTMSATASNTASGTGVVYTGLGDGSAKQGKQSGAAAPGRATMIEIGQVYSLGLIMVGFFAGFAILL